MESMLQIPLESWPGAWLKDFADLQITKELTPWHVEDL